MPRVAVQLFDKYESLSITSGAAVGLTASTISARSLAHLTLETAQVRYRMDGTSPTTTEGHLLDPGSSLELEGMNLLANIKFIAVNASATLKASYGN